MRVSDLTDEDTGSRVIVHCEVDGCDDPWDQIHGVLDSFVIEDDVAVIRVYEDGQGLTSWVGAPDTEIEVTR